jgi:hypothetical protein
MIALLAVISGLGVLALGLVLPDRVRSPWDGLIAFLAPLGLATALVGVLLLCVPDFFAANNNQTIPGESP